MQDKKRPVFTAALHRYMGKRMVIGYYIGYPIVNTVTVDVEMVLSAQTPDQLSLMVQLASVDGWQTNGRVE